MKKLPKDKLKKHQLGVKKPKCVLMLGSGGLKIGQAGEFDYSGTQAIKAYKEEGIRVVLVNPNIATIQTESNLADRVYFLPVTPDYVTQIIKKEKPDAIALSFGGQTALNCGVQLENSGVLKKYGVRVLGTPVAVIEDTEDRALFNKRLAEIDVYTPKSIAATSVAAAEKAAEKIGFPIMIRAAFALGGRGSGLCKSMEELTPRVTELFASSPQVLIEEWLGGWKEVEYEVVRDAYDNCITVCNMENIDPLGIHTGESIVVAPSQTLNNFEYHMLREVAIKTIRHLGVVGECNIQYALDPFSREYRVIEVNARLSRSSALASKATGYPLAYIAAKLSLGYALTELKNKVTGVTTACFEPALDYCVVKMPRWDLQKFKASERKIGSEMKSVGEVMGIGRTFEEALHKCIRMIDVGAQSIFDAVLKTDVDPRQQLSQATDTRIFAVAQALKSGMTVDAVHDKTRIDKFFLHCIDAIAECARTLESKKSLDGQLMRNAKQLGFSDNAIAKIKKTTEGAIRAQRKKWHITPVIKSIDTLAGEFPSHTEYLYTTYHGTHHDVTPLPQKKLPTLVLGSGTYRIGSSVEFDWCCMNAVQTIRDAERAAIILNSNPETVSTDYDMCDRLYFDELSLERVLDIHDFEHPAGVVVSMGGQTPNRLVTVLAEHNVHILGTSSKHIDMAEDRHKFSKLLDTLNIPQPQWEELSSLTRAKQFAKKVTYPVLVRPSYVLSGAAMNVVWNDTELESYLAVASDVSQEHPVVMTKFVTPAKEIEIDAVANNGEILCYAIGEHIENAGVHSGDATIVLPAQTLHVGTIRIIKRIARDIAKALQITGPFNIQFLAQNNTVSVIECNVRASRSFPFCSKVFKTNFVTIATKALLGEKVDIVQTSLFDVDYVGVKAAQFSFSRLKGADPRLGVEMASTGEVAALSHSVPDALLKALTAVDVPPPKKGILLSLGSAEHKGLFLKNIHSLRALNVPLYATNGTARVLLAELTSIKEVTWDDALKLIDTRAVDCVINTPTHANGEKSKDVTQGMKLRRHSVDRNVPLITDAQLAESFIEALVWRKTNENEIKGWDEY
jgi:carbamoyl-phosphate synthase large subunit